MTPEQIVAEVTTRIRQADAEAELSAAAFAAGPKTAEAYLAAQRDKIFKQIDEAFNGSPADVETGDS